MNVNKKELSDFIEFINNAGFEITNKRFNNPIHTTGQLIDTYLAVPQSPPLTPISPSPIEVTELFENMGAFAKEKFPDAGSVEHLLKLHQEVDEAISPPSDITEYADCLLALFGAVHKAGYSFSDLLQAGFKKFDIVKSRDWERLSDGTYQHKSTKKQVTDEEITKAADTKFPTNNENTALGQTFAVKQQYGFEVGARWMRDLLTKKK